MYYWRTELYKGSLLQRALSYENAPVYLKRFEKIKIFDIELSLETWGSLSPFA